MDLNWSLTISRFAKPEIRERFSSFVSSKVLVFIKRKISI